MFWVSPPVAHIPIESPSPGAWSIIGPPRATDHDGMHECCVLTIGVAGQVHGVVPVVRVIDAENDHGGAAPLGVALVELGPVCRVVVVIGTQGARRCRRCLVQGLEL